MSLPPSTVVPRQPKWMTVTGWVLTILPAALFMFSASAKFIKPVGFSEQNAKMGWNDGVATTIGVVEVVCTLLFLFPKTAVLGAVLLTGYLGGAIATHVRIADPFIVPALVGVVVWLALYLRDGRVRRLLPVC